MTEDEFREFKRRVELDAKERPDGSIFGVARDDQKSVEFDVAEIALTWLQQNQGMGKPCGYDMPDPPDFVAHFLGGSSYAIEVTELVDGQIIAAEKLPRTKDEQFRKIKEWSFPEIESKIHEIVKKKSDRRYAEYSGRISLVICCDQMFISPEHVESINVTTSVFEYVLIVFGYMPNADGKGGGSYPVVPLAITPT